MKGETEPLNNWGTKAALHDAISECEDSDKVLIIFETKGCTGFRSANLTIAEAIYLMEQQKFNLLMGDE